MKSQKTHKIHTYLLKTMNILDRTWYLWFSFISSGIFQIAYSRYGFSATDDGFVLAYSRRILAGELPHIDFITIRPAGSAIFHSPFVLFGGDFTIYLSRLFVWFEFTLLAVAIVIVAERLLKTKFHLLARVAVAGVALFCSAHFFPLMAWYTIDGLFMIMLGSILVTSKSEKLKYVGYLVIALSYLCKQNFLPAVLVSPFIFSDWKKFKVWLALLLPGLVYLLPGLFTWKLSEYTAQLATQSDLNLTGLQVYQKSLPFMSSIFTGFIFSFLLFLPPYQYRNKQFNIGYFLALILILFVMKNNFPFLASSDYLNTGSFIFAGLFFGNLLFLLTKSAAHGVLLKYAIFIGLVVWCSAISLGYNNPALGSGLLLAILLIEVLYIAKSQDERSNIMQGLVIFLLIYLTVLAYIPFDIGRQKLIYQELPKDQLKYSLTGLLPGGRGIKTDYSRYMYFADLNKTIAGLNGRKFALLPENAAYWIKSNDLNPLPIDWPNKYEVNSHTELRLERSVDDLLEGGGCILLNKYFLDRMSSRLLPLDSSPEFPIIDFVKSNYRKVGESDYLEIYTN